MFKCELPCNVGDIVNYTDEYGSFDFMVDKIVIEPDETRIYGGDRGCITYARKFHEHCKIVD